MPLRKSKDSKWVTLSPIYLLSSIYIIKQTKAALTKQRQPFSLYFFKQTNFPNTKDIQVHLMLEWLKTHCQVSGKASQVRYDSPIRHSNYVLLIG